MTRRSCGHHFFLPNLAQRRCRVAYEASQDRRWRLENLSTTNPVIVNGKPLDPEGGPRASVILSEGDRIEMGEVAFVFRAR